MEYVPSHPILSCAQAKSWEAGILSGEPHEWAAMEKAGHRVALSVMEDFKEIGGLGGEAQLLVLCGKGHNGGDALLTAHTILSECLSVRAVVVFCFGEGALRPLARRALTLLRSVVADRVEVLPAEQALKPDRSYALCLDGIFGFQFRSPMDDAIARLIERVNDHPAIRFRAAIDLPSGASESTASTAFRADFTYATGIVKLPVVQPTNAAAVGRLRYVDIDLVDDDSVPEAAERILTPRLLASLGALRSSQSDKRTFGHLCIIGGSRSYPGAVMLAARAALRSGVGLVTAFVPEPLAPAYAAQHPEVMWVGCPQDRAGALSSTCLPLIRERSKKASALLIGPGLGDAAKTIELVRLLAIGAKIPMVFDADALRPEVIKKVHEKPFICTPHAGEFKRIAPALYAKGRFVPQSGVLVLKGPLTHITDGKITYYSPFGGPVLARGGSGDMLAGLIGGLLAQTPERPLLAACRGVVWHGLAADLLARAHGQVAVENSQLLEQLGPALTSTHARFIDGATGVHGSERPA